MGILSDLISKGAGASFRSAGRARGPVPAFARANRQIMGAKIPGWFGAGIERTPLGSGFEARLGRGMGASAPGGPGILSRIGRSGALGQLGMAAGAFGAANFIDRYAEGWYGQEGQAAAAIPSFLLRWQGAASALRAGTRGVGMIPKLGTMAPGGKGDQFVGNLGPMGVGMSAAKWGAKGLWKLGQTRVKNPLGSVSGPLNSFREYGQAFGNSAMAPDVGTQWASLGASVWGMKNPMWAPFIMGAAAGGVYGYYAATPAIPSMYKGPWTESNISGQTQEMGINRDQFGGGVFNINPSGPSAVRSPTVIQGQMALGQKMTSARRL